MAARVSAIRGGAKFKAEVEGLRELRIGLRDLLGGIANEADLSAGEKNAVIAEAHKRLQLELGEAAGLIRDAARRNSAASGWPAAVSMAIFRYSDLKDAERRKQRGALAGVRTGASRLGNPAQLRSGPRLGGRIDKSGIFVEWRAGYRFGPSRRGKGRITASAGRLIGMSIGRIMETGNRNTQATHAFRNAVRSMQGQVLRRAAAGYSAVVKFIAAKHGKVAA